MNERNNNYLLADYETIQAQVAYEWLPDKCDSILEIGCSSGYFTNRLKSKAQHIYGVDVSQAHIDIARERYENINFQTIGEDSRLPFDNAFFDVIVMLEVY